jgi:hypothetical protein
VRFALAERKPHTIVNTMLPQAKSIDLAAYEPIRLSSISANSTISSQPLP